MDVNSVAGLVAAMEQGGLPLEKYLQVSFLDALTFNAFHTSHSSTSLIAQLLEMPSDIKLFS